MTTQIATMAGKLAVVSGLALALRTSVGGTAAKQTDKDNYFARRPGSAGARAEVDAFDRYAPVDLSPVLLTSGFTATEITGWLEAPPSPDKPGRPYEATRRAGRASRRPPGDVDRKVPYPVPGD